MYDHFGTFHQKINVKYVALKYNTYHMIEVQRLKGIPLNFGLGKPRGNESSKEITNCMRVCIIRIIQSLYRRDGGRPQLWETVPGLLGADPPFIKGFFMGFGCGSAV